MMTMLPSISGLHVVRFASAAAMFGAEPPEPAQVGSPRMSASYASKSAAVFAAHCALSARARPTPRRR
jgi:hypothetical protein